MTSSRTFRQKFGVFARNLLVFFIFFYSLSFAMDYWRGKSLPVGNIPETIYLDTLNNTIDLTQLSRDEITIVYFWATWCGPCKVTSPSIKQLAKSYPVVSVAMASGESDEIEQYFYKGDTSSTRIPIINDDDQVISKQWGVHVTPTILFIKNGKILGYTTGISGYPSLWLRAWWLNKD